MTRLIAQLTNPVLPDVIGKGGTQKGGTALGIFITNIVSLLLIVAFLLALFFLLTGAISWITSGGDKNNLETARNRITHALVGLIIVGASWAIFVLINQFLGLSPTEMGGNLQLPIPSIGGQ